MRVFVTGASGFIGSAIVKDLLRRGHQVLGLARSDAAAASVRAAGAEVLRGSLEDVESVKRGADSSEGVIHTAFIHDFSAYENSIETDRTVVEAIGKVLEGSGRPLVIASGMIGTRRGELATEEDAPAPGTPRGGSEELIMSMATRDVRSSVVRLPPIVHSDGDRHGFTVRLIQIARKKGVCAYVGDGANRWPSVHQKDAVNLFTLALERGRTGSRFHAVADEGIRFRDIAEAIAKKLGVPTGSITQEAASEHFGFLAMLTGRDAPASSALTRERLGWKPVHPSLLEDIEAGHYFSS